MTSPAAKMCGTVVQNVSSTFSRPRSSTPRPAAPRLRRSVAATRPAENRTTSGTMRLPDSSNSTARGVGFDSTAIDATASPSRNVTLRLRIWCRSSSTISRSRNSSGRSRRSISVTATPSEANIERVLDADHAGADHRQRARQLLHPGDVVARDDDLAVGGDAGWGGRTRADGDDDAARAHRVGAVTDDLQAVRIDEGGFALEQGDVVALELVLDDRPLARHHVVDPRQQLLRGGPALGADPSPGVQDSAGPGEEDDGLAQRLAGDRAGVDADPPTQRAFSTTAVRRPSLAACTAARWPAGPLPMQIRS